jgi:hypothetical protein
MKALSLRFFLFVAVLLLLAACFEYEAEIRVEPDGSGKAVFVYRFPPGLLDQTDMTGQIPFNQEEVDTRYRMRAGITQYRAEFMDFADYKEVRIFLEFDDVASLSEKGNTFSYDIEGGHRVFRVHIDKHMAEGRVQRREQNPMQAKILANVLDRYRIRYRVYLPQQINESNAQDVEWNSATWEIPLNVFLNPEKEAIILEAKSQVSLWERVKWRASKILN